jgi:hypothetical protein
MKIKPGIYELRVIDGRNGRFVVRGIPTTGEAFMFVHENKKDKVNA